ncbi:small, acid-soluble spore protein K [Pullulanibacillus camelliae]|uniref:Small, acid-soluble spore protein K n=1 Tax=Pullulanibacillus camelliae TaxID=1707096 RepID=A0A8J2YJC3_9BACL|nr:small acid-soluble spore protein K [Pullulanibacillus camelliae]GGE47425.1 small, acid-soluble spore protein K [Pullulanibacillus camelliae]
MVDPGEKRYPVQNENSIQPRAKDEYSPKRANGQTKDHPMERMLMSNQRHQHEE